MSRVGVDQDHQIICKPRILDVGVLASILQTWTYIPQKRQVVSAFALTYIFRLRSCKFTDAFVISSLPSRRPERLQTAGPLCSTRPQTHPMSAFTSKTHQQRTLLAGECHPEGGRLPKRGRGSAASAGAFKLRPQGSVASCRRAVCARKVKRPRLNSMPHDQASKSLSGIGVLRRQRQ